MERFFGTFLAVLQPLLTRQTQLFLPKNRGFDIKLCGNQTPFSKLKNLTDEEKQEIKKLYRLWSVSQFQPDSYVYSDFGPEVTGTKNQKLQLSWSLCIV
jgi:hypothetical protein